MNDKLGSQQLEHHPHDEEDDIIMCPILGECESARQCSDGVCHSHIERCPGGDINCLTPQDCQQEQTCHAQDADEAAHS